MMLRAAENPSASLVLPTVSDPAVRTFNYVRINKSCSQAEQMETPHLSYLPTITASQKTRNLVSPA